jgi:hypothetical protein
LTKWRNRAGADRLNMMLQETVEPAVKDNQITKHELARVIVDTTVQEKNITYPTDSELYRRATTSRRILRRKSTTEPQRSGWGIPDEAFYSLVRFATSIRVSSCFSFGQKAFRSYQTHFSF